MLKITLKLAFYDFGTDPDKITDLLNIQPSEVLVQGKSYMNGNHEYKAKTNTWRLEQIVGEDEMEDIVLSRLLKHTVPAIKRAGDSFPEHYTELAVVINTDEANPGLHFSLENLEQLALISAELDIDIYALG